ncbi:MAG: hypothetical protein ACNA77_04010 [Opitutales bacterium]
MKKSNPLFASLLLGTSLIAAPAHAATIVYEFTGGSLAPTASGLPAGVTASNFSIGSFDSATL